MFYHIFYELWFDPEGWTSVFRVFKYITLRTAYATLTALLISFILGPFIIRLLKREGMTQVVRKNYLPNHVPKEATPTCGGLMIMTAIIGSMLLWGKFTSRFTLLILFTVLWFGGIGFLDDYLKFIRKRPEGLTLKYKLGSQTIGALAIAVYLYLYPIVEVEPTKLNVPFFTKPPIDLGLLYIPFIVLVIVGASNAVNLTDGLDGLATGSVIFAAITYTGLTYVAGHYKFAEYLRIPYVSGCGELTVFLGALIGACLGFLWFNAHPAQIFMGDTGSLMLGGVLGTIAVLTKNELLLLIIGGLFVIEALSVILQVGYYKLKRKRIFRMSPLHHHFELVGWPEPKITIRFWIIAIIFALLSLSTLKLR
jgi:phospho-N-acetylmuramoyl-pentapeptide-transferase